MSQGVSVNKHGTVVGAAYLDADTPHAFDWKGEMRDLDPGNSYDCSYAKSINAEGEIVGWAERRACSR